MNYGIELRTDGHYQHLAGYIMPWWEEIEIFGTTERFAPGAFDAWIRKYGPAASKRSSKRIALNTQHNKDNLIGVMTATENRQAGQWAEFRLANTPRAKEAAQLVTDGVLGGFSVEFRDKIARTDGTVERAELTGVGLVACPAYDGATLQRSYNKTRLAEWQAIINKYKSQRRDT